MKGMYFYGGWVQLNLLLSFQIPNVNLPSEIWLSHLVEGVYTQALSIRSVLAIDKCFQDSFACNRGRLHLSISNTTD